MLKATLSLILITFLIHIQLSKAQSVVGFWEAKEVMVGKEIKTPVAKWTKIHKDGSYQSGNGGIQNSEGTWSFDKKDKFFLPAETNGIKEPYGGFKVTFVKEQMLWQREEDGDVVIVKWERVEKLPKSPADLLVGLWDLKEITKNGTSEKSLFDPNDLHYIFIRWDRIYVERTPQGDRASGYWHINAHHPEITLISHNQGKTIEKWRIEVTDQELKMEGMSDSNKGTKIVYERIHEFPK
jgi:hypothetical protein